MTLFRRRLALGAALLRVFLVTRAAGRPAEPVTAPDGTRLTAHDQRPPTDYAVFGNVRGARHAFTASGHEGGCPLDAALSVPAHGSSDRRREWAVDGTTDASSRERQTVLARILGVSLRLQAIETAAAEAGQDVTTFYAQPAEPTIPSPMGTILVVPADGNGVPMGPKRGTKQEAVVTGLDTMAPYPRTPQEVVGALRQEPDRLEPAARPQPEGKERHATLAGKGVALSRRRQQVAQGDGPHIQPRVARTDGAEARQPQVVTHVPEHTLGLAIIHATESLWDTANTLLGATHPQRLAWVGADLEPLRAGQIDSVITALEAEGKTPTGTVTQRQAVRRTVGDYRRHRPSRRYDESLAWGWPMGTGVVEGAWGHLVKDRREPSGMRWTTGGAQAVLDLRAVRLNGGWDTSWPCHRQPQHQRLYGRSAPAPALAETRALEWAA
jgi:hypothetical protein